MKTNFLFRIVLVILTVLFLAASTWAESGRIIGWGSQVVGVDLSNGFVAVSAGGYHSLGLKQDGSIVTFGNNWYDQCNLTLIGTNIGFMDVVGGNNHSLGLKTDGSIKAWGRNDYGQCNVPTPNSSFVMVDTSYDHSLGLKADGSIVAWGYNANGQCIVPSPNSGFVKVAAGGHHSLGLKADGSIVAWGAGRPGRSGWPHYGQSNVPAPNSGFVAVSAGGLHSLGLKGDGSIVAWGNNEYGQCNIASPKTGFVAIAAGGYHSLGLKEDGSIRAWGRNDYGQCNIPSPNNGFVAVEAGAYHSIGLKADGSIIAWGSNNYSQCNIPTPNSGFVALAAGWNHNLGLKADSSVPPGAGGYIVAWGSNNYGQCNVPSPNSGFVAVEAGAYHSIGLKADGSIIAWGRNNYGQCNVPTPNSGFVAIAAGWYHSLGLKQDGSIRDWGRYYGRCPSPNTGFVAVATGFLHSLGLKSNGSIVAWGDNRLGQCDVPLPNNGFVAVAAGERHSLGLKSDGSIVAWGANWCGLHNVPSPNSGFTAIAAGSYHNLGLLANRTPVACIAGGDQIIEVGSDCEARVVLDGSCSSDEDSTPGTNNDINDFDWYEIIDPCDPNSDILLGSGEIIECNLPFGDHIVVLEVTDMAGESDSNEVRITVEGEDTTPPVISCPCDITVYARLPAGAEVAFEVNAVDLCDSQVEIVSSPASGSIFAPGQTTVICTATDNSGNSASCSFTITVIAPIEMAMHFTPGALNPGSEGNWMKAHFVLPEGYETGDIDVNTPAVLEPLGIESEYINVFVDRGRLGEPGVEIGFERRRFCEAVGDYGPAEVTVVGLLTTGQYFYGTDTIRIIDSNLKYLAVIAYHWLEADCGPPNWCDSADLDQDTVVDFVDFALFDGCCIEVVKK